MAEVCVKLENVTKEFPSCKALDDVSLSIEEGEFFSLLGLQVAAKRRRSGL